MLRLTELVWMRYLLFGISVLRKRRVTGTGGSSEWQVGRVFPKLIGCEIILLRDGRVFYY